MKRHDQQDQGGRPLSKPIRAAADGTTEAHSNFNVAKVVCLAALLVLLAALPVCRYFLADDQPPEPSGPQYSEPPPPPGYDDPVGRQMWRLRQKREAEERLQAEQNQSKRISEALGIGGLGESFEERIARERAERIARERRELEKRALPVYSKEGQEESDKIATNIMLELESTNDISSRLRLSSSNNVGVLITNSADIPVK